MSGTYGRHDRGHRLLHRDNIVRLVIGSDNKFVVPISMAVGAFLLLFADYIAYQLSNIPVGVVMSLIGSPVFFILIVLQSRKSGVIY